MPQRLRAATAHTPRGSSSVLRLSAAATRLPSGVDIAQWIDRSARAWHAEATRPAEL
jgi:type II secretory pathway component PulM